MAIDLFKYIGPGLLVTVGFVDPGNWAANIAAGARYGYSLLWMITLSTVMLVILQHNAAHLGIVTGKCLAEAVYSYIGGIKGRLILGSAILAAISTALAEMLGGAVALNMLFHIPIKAGAFIMMILSLYLEFSSSYKRIEKIIIIFVSIIGVSFVIEAGILPVDWGAASRGWVVPSIPPGSMPIILSVLGSVIMPHNLFLHSEVVQSRQWNLKEESVIKYQLIYEYTDTLFAMTVGWAINSAIVFIAASTFFTHGIYVDDLSQAGALLTPLMGPMSALLFGIALLFAGIASSITSAMAGGSIFAGAIGEPYDAEDPHTRLGSILTMGIAYLVILFVSSPFEGLIYSQVFLSMQLPITIFTQLYLTSSTRIMGKFANHSYTKVVLWIIGLLVTGLNIYLVIDAVIH